MKNFLLLLLTIPVCMAHAQSDYEKAWNALNKNDRETASKLLQSAMNDPATFQDAFAANILLSAYNGSQNAGNINFEKEFYSKADNVYPYLYALWRNKALLGEPGKKTMPHQVALATRIANDEKAPGTLRASANYQQAYHYKFSNAFDKAVPFINKISGTRNWQFAGPFENISESGIDKNYGPLEHPEAGAVFYSLANAPVKWFTPPVENDDSWIPFEFNFSEPVAVIYAQTFLTSPEDINAVMAVGFSGNIKVWLNDRLLITETKERITDYDAYAVKCNLKKGVNRVLVQVGYSDIDYPNFVVRFTDENFNPLTGLTSAAEYKPYTKDGEGEAPQLLNNFAEKYFGEKIAKDSSNLVNYLLLSNAYMRSKKIEQARNVLELAKLRAPQNALIVSNIVNVLQQEGNETLLEQEKHLLQQLDPKNYYSFIYYIYELYENDKLAEMTAKLDEFKKIFADDLAVFGFESLLFAKEKRYDDIITLMEKIYQKYPEWAEVQEAMYTIKKEVEKDKEKALEVYEKFFKNSFNYKAYEKYANALLDAGYKDKYLELWNNYEKLFPYSSGAYTTLSNYYFSIKDYDKAESNIKKSIELAPYNKTYWEKLGDIKMQQNKKAEAMEAYANSLQYDPQQYALIEKTRRYSGKKDVLTLFPPIDENKLISEDKKAGIQESERGYYFIHDQKDVVIYPNGAAEQYVTILIRVINEDGVDYYKQANVGGTPDYSTVIEKAEVIKETGRVQGEKNGTSIVFTNLQPGDVLYIRYKEQNFATGRFMKDFTDKYFFDGVIYSRNTKYNLLAPPSLKINYKFSREDIKPLVSATDDFKSYQWQLANAPAIKEEPLMPVIGDVSNTLYLSTIPSWNDIAVWYSDIVNNRVDADYDVKQVYAKLFPAGKTFPTQFAKAKHIYDYLMNNIRYSSVSFRQSGYVPQKASKTLNTRLGDCKDLSSLFVTLAAMAGIQSQMVLVDTRDNGVKRMLLPETGFNHCIAKANLDGRDYYIELTDMDLPFASVPRDIKGAVMLEIPAKNQAAASKDISLINPVNKKPDVTKRIIEMKPNGNDMDVKVSVTKTGALTSGIRSDFKNLTKDDSFKEMQEIVSAMYQTNAKLNSVEFFGLNELIDSAGYKYSYTVKDLVSEVGSVNAFKINYLDIVASLNNFTVEERKYPFEYWSYEDADAYDTEVIVTAPAGTKFTDVPKSEAHSFQNMKYNISFNQAAPGRLVIKRTFTTDRPQQISPADYEAFTEFFEKIVKVEQKFITYK